jgi:hypothetical protein
MSPNYPFRIAIARVRRWFAVLGATADSHPYLFLGLIAGLALVINIISLIVRPPTTELGQPQLGQTYRWWPLILNLINGRGYLLCIQSYFPFCGPGNEITASLEPVPVLFFGGIALLTHQSLFAAALAEVGINLVILLTTFWMTRLLVNTRAALAAALLWAAYIPAIKLVSQISGDLLGACLLTLGIFFFLRARDSQRWWDFLLSGIALGLAIQSRSALLVVIPGLWAGLLVEGWAKNRDRWAGLAKNIRLGIFISAIVFSTMLPWLVRNSLVFGSSVVGMSLTGYVLYRQNYMLGTDNYLRVVGSEEAYGVVRSLVARRPDLSRALNEVQMDGVYRAEALKIITAYPARYVLLSTYRFLPLWFNWKVDEAYGDQTPLLAYAIMLEQFFLLAFALFGVWKMRQRSWPLWVSIIFVSAAYMAVNGQIRYLVPVMPFVISLGMAGLQPLFAAQPARVFVIKNPRL